MWRRCVVLFVAGIAVSWGLILQVAEGDAPKTRSSARKPTGPELPAFTPEREISALEFVREHHPELGEVLTGLKTLKPEEYEQAIREIFQTQQRLAAVKGGDEKLYELLREAWTVNSRIELLAARLACAREKNVTLESELKRLLYKQVDLQRQQVEHNRERLLASLKNMEANLTWLAENRESLVEKRFRNLTRVCANVRDKSPKQAPTADTDRSEK
jgi:hypothetical protein